MLNNQHDTASSRLVNQPNCPRPFSRASQELGTKARVRRQVLAEWDGRCRYCLRSLPRNKATLDHVIPRSRKGRFAKANLVVCCRTCNQAKRDRTPEEWAADILASVPRMG